MLYAILCYKPESVISAWTKEKDDAVMAEHGAVLDELANTGKLGTVARLMFTTTATTVRSGRETIVMDGPFAETKEQLLGFYVVDCATLEEVIKIADRLSDDTGAMEIRPIRYFNRGNLSEEATR